MTIDELLIILNFARENITRPVAEINCRARSVTVILDDGTILYLSEVKVVNDDDKGQTHNSSDADEPTHEGRQ